MTIKALQKSIESTKKQLTASLPMRPINRVRPVVKLTDGIKTTAPKTGPDSAERKDSVTESEQDASEAEESAETTEVGCSIISLFEPIF